MGSKKRTIRTTEQQIADAEAKLAKLKAKADDRNEKQVNELLAKRDRLVLRLAKIDAQLPDLKAKGNDLDEQIHEIDNKLEALDYVWPETDLQPTLIEVAN